MYVFVCERGSLRFCVLNKFHFLRGFGKYLVMNEESVKENEEALSIRKANYEVDE